MNLKHSLLVLCLSAAPACASDLTGTVTIFSAASLTGALAAVDKEFAAVEPKVQVQREASATKIAARKVVEQHRQADIIVAADEETIPKMLEPQYTGWSAGFLRERLAILYTEHSKFAAEITKKNWHKILLRPEVDFGVSNPDVPVGYRALLCWKLSELHYKKKGFFDKMSAALKDKNTHMDAAALAARLKAGEMDYIFDYASLGQREGLKVLELPAEVDLGDPKLAKVYGQVEVTVPGSEPGKTQTVKGKPIVYSVTLLKDAPNAKAAEAYLAFLLGAKGREILATAGLIPMMPPVVDHPESLPAGLRELWLVKK